MGFTTTVTQVCREVKLPPLLELSAERAVSRIAAILCLSVAFAGVAAAQYTQAPKVGGASTFDTPPDLSGNDSATARRKLGPLAAIPEDFSTLQLGPGFLLNMDVYDTPEYSLELRIDADGDVNIPMVGTVHVGELTLVEAATKIAASLRDGKILTDPQVNLNIEEYAGSDITVLGEVHSPGRIELLAPRHLDDVIAMAGGETEYAGDTIEIRHHQAAGPTTEVVHYSRSVDNHILSETVVFPGETVTVRRAGIVYVLGAVNRPGGYLMQEDGNLNVSQALALAYGTTMPAGVGSMRLIRKKDDGQVEEIPIPYRDMVKGKVAPLRLQAEDVIYVPVSKLKETLGAGLVNTGVAAAVIYGH
jgi:polysaccharide export outer membrane protein